MRHAKRQAGRGGAGARRERGAALVTMLLTSTLLLAAGGALIVTTSMGAGTAADSTSEMQAYYVAESGLQSTLNVMRGHTRPLAASGLNPDTDNMTFRNAVVPNKSNSSASTAGPFTLAAWLPYNATGNAPVSLLVGALTVTGGYRVTVEDPDNSHVVTFATSSSLGAGTVPLGNGLAQLNVSFTAGGTTLQPANRNALPYSFANTGLGQVAIQRPTTSLLTAAAGTQIPFTLTVSQSAPWSASAQFPGRLTVVSAATIRLSFDTPTTKGADGTRFALAAGSFDIAYPAVGTTTNGQISSTVSAPDPKRLIVRSIGLGPRGSRKQLEMLLTRSNFEFEAPATLTMQGAGDCSPMNFSSGSSGAKTYSGHDRDSGEIKPAVAVTPCDVQETEDGIKKHGTISDPEIGVLGNGTPTAGTTTALPTTPVGTPSFLETADAARAYLNELEALAHGQNRYFKPAAGTSRSVNDGTAAAPQLTFVDGDCELEGGAGVVVCTGALNMSGNPSFDGIVLVLGEGRVNRNGGGNGDFYGAMVIASFARTWPASENGQPHPFLAPSFNTNGGGNSTMRYSSTAVSRAFAALGSSVGGVREF